MTAKLFVRKRCRHGNVASLFLQEEGVIGIRKIFLHVNEVVTNGRHLNQKHAKIVTPNSASKWETTIIRRCQPPPLCSSKVVTGVPSFITHVVAGVGKTCHAASEPSNPRWFVGGWSVFGGCSAYFKPESPIQSSLSKKQTKISIQPSPVRRHRKGPSSHFRKSDLWMLQKLPTSISASENLWWMKEWCQKHRNVYFLRLRACNDASSIIVRPHGILQYGRCS